MGRRSADRPEPERLETRIVGSVQGVGFRPFVHRLATELELAGHVCNDDAGVRIEVEGTPEALRAFRKRVVGDAPPAATVYTVDHRSIPATRAGGDFRIVESVSGAPPRVWVLPDLAVCPDCRSDIRRTGDRRHRYAFTNCTHCGPRFTIIDDLPYDRARTAMRGFDMCTACAAEYEDPSDRRFHAQPNACPRCGPRLSWARTGAETSPVLGPAALDRAVEAIRDGAIVAVKGLGGFHLVCDARSEEAVSGLRARKRRSRKAFAVMCRDLESLSTYVEIPDDLDGILTSAQAPIAILRASAAARAELAPSIAPGSPYLGVFLPYTPLHVLLLDDLGFPVVATSGNLSDDPIQHDDRTASRVLGPIADGILSHDRPIRRPADDSVVHVLERPRPAVQILRRARGYAPLPLLAPVTLPPMVALGGHMNVTIAFSRGREIVVSQHLGDLDGFEAREAYERTLDDLLRLYGVEPELAVHDLHPDYFTTLVAERRFSRRIAVQHHHAHLAACLLDNAVDVETLGLTWDGTGYGDDGTVWGGEFLLGDSASSRRVASLEPFRLPGGEVAVREPWRVAVALVDRAFDGAAPVEALRFEGVPERSIGIVRRLSRSGVGAPSASSIGRLFDGVAALLGLATTVTHSAEAAQQLEYAAWRAPNAAFPLPMPVGDGGPGLRVDWRPTVRAIVDARTAGVGVEAIAAGFHAALVDAAIVVVEKVGCPRVALTGGAFANRWLTEALSERLEVAGRTVLKHGLLPMTDGGLAAGQLYASRGLARP